MIVEIRIIDAAGADRLVPGGEIDADLGRSVRWLKDTVSATVAGEVVTESLAKGEDFGRASPARGGGAGRWPAKCLGDRMVRLRDLLQDDLLREPMGGDLPSMMIPGMHADFVAGLIDVAKSIPQSLVDDRSGPDRPPEKDVPSIGACRLGAKHLSKEGRAEKAPQMASHVVGTDGEEERSANSPGIEDTEQFGYPVSGTAKRVDIDPKPEFHAFVAIFRVDSALIPIERTWSSMNQSTVRSTDSLVERLGAQSRMRFAFFIDGRRC